MNATKIEYLDYTWNPLAMRCTPVSEGCNHCWHLSMANRMAANPTIKQPARNAYAGNQIVLTNRLNDPLKKKKPLIIGVQFMGDLFHEKVPIEFHLSVWDRIARSPMHIFMILTKRPQRMAEVVSEIGVFNYGVLPNLWLGVTAENQARYDERARILVQIPAAKRFVSYQPALGPLNIRFERYEVTGTILPIPVFHGMSKSSNLIHLLICGGETGPGARPMHPDWARSVRDQCVEAGVPFFFKGWGEWAPRDDGNCLHMGKWCRTSKGQKFYYNLHYPGLRGTYMQRIGKKTAGRLLDGRTWEEFPEVVDAR
ncbi:MAG: phage Gp37/Gp68 family protein [Syntrophobacteraceae bacterium]